MAKKKPNTPTDLRSLRSRLRKLDAELVKLLVDRRKAAAALVDREGVGDSLLDRLLADEQRLAKLAEGIEPWLAGVLRDVIAAERNAQQPVRVAYLGPENTFSHQAASHRFGKTAELAPVGTIAAVFAAVERGDCGFGVVPLENSTDGRVSDTLECFAATSARICGELPLRIHHCLLGTGGRAGVKRVLSKPQALSQCRNWLSQNLPHAEAEPVASTAEAARKAKADPAVAAIASERAGREMGLAILAHNVEDHSDNLTRFAVIGPGEGSSAGASSAEAPKAEPPRTGQGKTGNDKTALMFEMPHQPGALADAMGVFKRAQLNMTWIESFPIPGKRGSYRFFVEFEGHQAEVRPRRAIASLAKKATRLDVLGSYPVTEPIE